MSAQPTGPTSNPPVLLEKDPKESNPVPSETSEVNLTLAAVAGPSTHTGAPEEVSPFKSPAGSQNSYVPQQQYESPAIQKVPSSGHVGTSYPLPPPPPQPILLDRPPNARQLTNGGRMSNRRSAIDWIVPLSEDDHDLLEKPSHLPKTYGERLRPTLIEAEKARQHYAQKAKTTGWTLNAAIGLQVLLGSLTTGLSAVATSGKSAAVQTTILGGLATIVASYLARARGSNEPELSITRTKDLEQFIRECKSFQMDFGHLTGTNYDSQLNGFRRRFEDLLGNANGERKLSPPV